jgi:hypothetical protein
MLHFLSFHFEFHLLALLAPTHFESLGSYHFLFFRFCIQKPCKRMLKTPSWTTDCLFSAVFKQR